MKGKIMDQCPCWLVPGRIAYVVNHSFPFIVVMAMPLAFSKKDLSFTKVIGGVRYFYLKEPSENVLEQEVWLDVVAGELEKLFQVFKPSVVIAASNWKNAFPGQAAAQKLNL